MTKIKICGLSRPEDVQAVNQAGADYAGFVFAPSKRQVSPKLAGELIAQLKPGIMPVGVFAQRFPGRDCHRGAADRHSSGAASRGRNAGADGADPFPLPPGPICGGPYGYKAGTI